MLLTDAVRRNDAKLTAVCIREKRYRQEKPKKRSKGLDNCGHIEGLTLFGVEELVEV